MGGASVRKMRDQQKTEGEMGEGLLYGCCQLYDKGDGCGGRLVVAGAMWWWWCWCEGKGEIDIGQRGEGLVQVCFLFMVEKMVVSDGQYCLREAAGFKRLSCWWKKKL